MTVRAFVDVAAPGFVDSLRLNVDQLISFVYEESLDGCAKWALNLTDKDSDAFRPFIVNDGASGKTFKFRFGLVGTADPIPLTGALLSNWKTLELLQTRKRTLGEMTLYNFTGLCHGHALNRHNKPDGNWENKRISEIVKELAEDAGLQTDIEETVGQYTISNGKNKSGPFIKDYLLPLAYSKSGRKDWRFWVRDGSTVVFRPTNHTEGAKHIFSDRVMNDPSILSMKGPEIVKTVASQVWDGSGRSKVTVHDPMVDRYQQHEVYEGNAAFNYLGKGKPKDRQKGTEVEVPTRFTEKRNVKGLTTAEQMKHEAETRWARNARSLYKMVSEVQYSTGLSPGDKVRVLVRDNKDPDEATGLWQLHTIRNICTRGAIRSYVVLERRWETQ